MQNTCMLSYIVDALIASKKYCDFKRYVVTFLFYILGLNESHVESMQHLVRPFSSSELIGLAGAFRAANLTDKDLAVLNAVMGEASQSLSDVNRFIFYSLNQFVFVKFYFLRKNCNLDSSLNV